MTRKDTPPGADIISSFLPIFTEIFPLVLEKWADIHDRPVLRDLEDEQDAQARRLEKAEGQVRWLFALLLVVVVWNVFLTILVTVLLVGK